MILYLTLKKNIFKNLINFCYHDIFYQLIYFISDIINKSKDLLKEYSRY